MIDSRSLSIETRSVLTTRRVVPLLRIGLLALFAVLVVLCLQVVLLRTDLELARRKMSGGSSPSGSGSPRPTWRC